MKTTLEKALKNVSKFNTLRAAESWSASQKCMTKVLLGENNLFLVPLTYVHQTVLIQNGYNAI